MSVRSTRPKLESRNEVIPFTFGVSAELCDVAASQSVSWMLMVAGVPYDSTSIVRYELRLTFRTPPWPFALLSAIPS
jgi:hypothetical protein